ncbi:hypothetical protein PsorP6_003029 [Peronosclerospora sorghi]|uniref:Uncharacterized protein n=1 Tax=Peronosclerospora sorghi TaxID=230839 RepID=A0ACC0VK09_9STRA|nr:hypothetical protein PsorP6_003029 [Peronosclerospora sorghi]
MVVGEKRDNQSALYLAQFIWSWQQAHYSRSERQLQPQKRAYDMYVQIVIVLYLSSQLNDKIAPCHNCLIKKVLTL